MEVTVSISSVDLTEEDLQALTRDLCTTIARETSMDATLPEETAGTGAKGAEIAIGTIVLTFLTSGSAVALFNVLKSYFDRSSSVEVELEREDGRKLKIKAHNVQPDQIERTLGSAREFFGGA